jgi:ACS family glucarate transporter-like MFS transporter/ACS family D-galactonate transporter-like MFS transporter
MPMVRRSLACGILITGMQLGAIAAGSITGILLENTTWRSIFILYSIPGIVWVLWFWNRFRDDPAQARNVNRAELAIIQDEHHQSLSEGSHRPTPWHRIAQNLSVWLLSGQQICRSAGYVFFVFWFPTFLQETRGITVKDSGYLQALVFSGTLLGGLLGGGLADLIWRRTNSLRLSRSGVGTMFLLGCAVLIVAAWFVESTGLAVALLTVGSLFAALAGPCAFSASIDIGGRYTPQVFGIMNMMGNFSAAACPVLVGVFFDWTANWNLVLLLFAGIYLTGALCWVLIDPSEQVVE